MVVNNNALFKKPTMANKEHLAALRKGTVFWNKWRERNPDLIPDLSGEDLRGINLCPEFFCPKPNISIKNVANLTKANLCGSNFSDAQLAMTDFSKADLREVNFQGAQLSEANFSGADLSSALLMQAGLWKANFSGATLIKAGFCNAVLSEANFTGATLKKTNLARADLMDTNFRRADLNEAVLAGAYLVGTNFIGADLSRANLCRAQALGTNFTGAIFTGACLQEWNVNSATKLDEIDCQYVYRKSDNQERRPSSGEFMPGEFAKLFQKVVDTVDLIFADGIDWQAFVTSFQKLQVECSGEELSIQAIENKNDGAFVIRVKVPPDANKKEIEKYLKREYRLIIKAKDEQILLLREEILSKRQENTSLLRIIHTMAEKENSKYYFNQPQIGNFIDTAQSGSYQTSTNHQHNYAPEQKQTLAEAAVEIEQLLDVLTQKYNPKDAQQKVANDLAQQAQSNPTVKERLVKWGQYLSDSATNGLIGEAAVEVLKLALKLSGIPLP
jgi:uncharacterized protein YjbI with pentapeptide repeats